MGAHVVKVAAAAVTAICLTGCSMIADVTDSGDSFEDRAEALDAVYEQGKQSRKKMEKLGVIVDETSCGSSWVTSGAKDAENDMDTTRNNRANDVNFQELRRLSFINGCMDRPNSLPAVVAPSLRPSASASPR
ncbi:hypothetical protein [Actinoplanes teichomyceticus]|uniref:Lipoprotein n=1 Tax=Actinoplanes teichomyceticus TaxID=1867 RepID=A0A561WBZ0_ACTTI|nr:hypothetical protein [Actinoplanes teichomyceticus]TWG21386.1 hypothetical protein FHX34_103924 [Actinoplanes teichomyceticus]GIF17187.1 hypothetical protein Ate01nite_72190 [Actinoplanes teichomyceticus]